MFGHIIGGEPNPDYRRGILTADLAIGDTVLHVDDTGDFDEDAKIQTGRIMLGLEYDDNGDFDPTTATILYYDTCDEDTLTVTLLAASPVAGSTGDTVYVYDPATGVPIVDYTVWVERDGGDPDGDPLPVILSSGLIDRIGDSTDLTGQAIEFHEDEDGELVATDNLPGSAPSAGVVKAKALDSLTVTTLGDQTMQLTYRPIPESEHLRWNGDSQDYDDFTRDQWTVTIPDPDGVLEVGDVLTMQYLYTDPTKVAMSELVLAPTRAFSEGFGSSHIPYIVASDVSGGASVTAWIDGSDASYGKCDFGRSARGQYPQWFSVDPTIDPSWITAIGVRFRASCPTTANAPFIVQLYAQASKLLSQPSYGGDLPLLTDPTPGTWTDYDYIVGAGDYDTSGWAPLGLASAADPTLTLYCRTVPSDSTGVFTSSDVILIAEQRLVIYYTIPA